MRPNKEYKIVKKVFFEYETDEEGTGGVVTFEKSITPRVEFDLLTEEWNWDNESSDWTLIGSYNTKERAEQAARAHYEVYEEEPTTLLLPDDE